MRQLRGRRSVVRELMGYNALGRLAIATITRFELHSGMREHERYATQKLLSRFETVVMDREIADRAGDLMRSQRERGKQLDMADAIIAATALTHELTLLALNRAHFETIPGLSLAPLGADLT